MDSYSRTLPHLLDITQIGHLLRLFDDPRGGGPLRGKHLIQGIYGHTSLLVGSVGDFYGQVRCFPPPRLSYGHMVSLQVDLWHTNTPHLPADLLAAFSASLVWHRQVVAVAQFAPLPVPGNNALRATLHLPVVEAATELDGARLIVTDAGRYCWARHVHCTGCGRLESTAAESSWLHLDEAGPAGTTVQFCPNCHNYGPFGTAPGVNFYRQFAVPAHPVHND